MEKKETIKVYSKFCLPCVDKKWLITRSCLMNDYIVKEYRTALNPVWHYFAKKAAGTEDYEPFVLFEDGAIKTVKELEDGKKKVPKVRRNSAKKPVRKTRVARKKDQASKKVEE